MSYKTRKIININNLNKNRHTIQPSNSLTTTLEMNLSKFIWE